MEPNAPQQPDGSTGDQAVEPPAATRRRRGVLMLLGGLALAAVTASAALYGPTTWRMLQEGDAKLTMPAEAVGLRLDESTGAEDTADYLRTALAAGAPLGNTVAAVYADPAAPTKSVFIVGGTARLRVPERDLDLAFRLLTGESGKVEGLHAVPAGNFGGIMKCGTSTAADAPMVVCGWADHGSLAVAMFPGRSIDESAELLRGLRSSIERRN